MMVDAVGYENFKERIHWALSSLGVDESDIEIAVRKMAVAELLRMAVCVDIDGRSCKVSCIDSKVAKLGEAKNKVFEPPRQSFRRLLKKINS